MILDRTSRVDFKLRIWMQFCQSISPNSPGPGHDSIDRMNRTDPINLASSVHISWFIMCLRFFASWLEMISNLRVGGIAINFSPGRPRFSLALDGTFGL